MLAHDPLTLRSGEMSPVTAYFIYGGSPNYGEIPCNPEKKERVIVLQKGQKAPRITSCKNHEALWKFVVEQIPTD